MSTRREDGGPAFPGPLTDYGRTGYEGMMLRDWFAGQALNGLLANNESWRAANVADHADTAYQLADAMLKARRS